jgi:ATP synthase protein I
VAKHNGNRKSKEDFSDTVDKKVARRLKARRSRNRGVWFGMGMFGLVGWTVAIYTILGVALGTWIDRRWPSGYSWTLSFLLIGLATGILNAWHWLKKEIETPEDEEENR